MGRGEEFYRSKVKSTRKKDQPMEVQPLSKVSNTELRVGHHCITMHAGNYDERYWVVNGFYHDKVHICT